MRKLARYALTVVAGSSAVAIGLLLLAPGARALLDAGHSEKPENALSFAELAQRSVVYAGDGSVLTYLHVDQNRVEITIDRVPPGLINAILDVEDANFWQHRGINLKSTARALRTNVESGEVREGGSTITQQLVKQTLLTPERNAKRKVREAVLAMRLEDQLTKEQILERYLNTVYFGSGAYGVQAAAETYFH